jgi:hypothetical protein
MGVQRWSTWLNTKGNYGLAIPPKIVGHTCSGHWPTIPGEI